MGEPARVFAASFLLLLAVDFAHLRDPPYWDAITGVYSQGLWLADHGFDYAGLLQQPAALDGGPLVNALLVYAPLFGALSLSLAPEDVFLVLHLLNLVWAAVAMATLFAMLRAACPLWLAALWVAAAALGPVWSGQVAAIYLEVPAATCALLSLRSLQGGACGRAAGWCLAGYFVKDSLLLLATAYTAFAVLQPLLVRLRLPVGGISPRERALLVAPLAAMLALRRLSGSHLALASDASGRASELLEWVRLCCPDLAVASLFAGALFAGSLGSARARRGWGEGPRAALVPVLALLVAGFWLAAAVFLNSLVRYTTLIALPLAALLALLLAPRRRVSAAAAAALAVFGLANREGALLPELPVYAARSGDFLERSREFLRDLRGSRAVCARLEAEHFAEPVVARVPFVQMLTRPELGYVKRPLPHVLAAGVVPTGGGVSRFDPAGAPGGAVVLFSPNIYEASWRPRLRPRPGRGDRLLFAEQSGLSQPVVVYRRAER